MDLGLEGRTALVTGGSSGIGLGIASCLAREGATVIVASRDPDRVASAVARLSTTSPRVRGETVDLLDEASVRALWGRVGGVDALVNNVGGPAPGAPNEVTLDAWDRGYRALVRSVLLQVRLAAPHMRARRFGRVLTVTSSAARQWIPGLTVSSTFRAGLTALAKGLAQELGPSGILVNNLLPGPVDTARLHELGPSVVASMKQATALGRLAEPEELGRVAAFLLSAANTYVTGTDVLVDGGATTAL